MYSKLYLVAHTVYLYVVSPFTPLFNITQFRKFFTRFNVKIGRPADCNNEARRMCVRSACEGGQLTGHSHTAAFAIFDSPADFPQPERPLRIEEPRPKGRGFFLA
jgi:hypothetical protein